MKFKATLKLNLTFIDEKYSNLRKHKRKEPIGEPMEIVGDLESIKEKLNSELDIAAERLREWYYGEGEEN